MTSHSPDEIERRLRRLRRLAQLLDSAVGIPGTRFRLGADSIIGLLPVGGDAVMAVLGGYIVIEAIRFGVPGSLVLRMLANLAIDFGIGSVPVAGDVFDVFFKANNRNLALLEDWLARAGR